MMRVSRRFTLRIMMVAITSFVILAAVVSERGRRQLRAVTEITSAGGQAYYQEVNGKPSRNSQLCNVLVRPFGKDNVCSVVGVTLRISKERPADEQLSMLRDLPWLRQIWIVPSETLKLPNGTSMVQWDAPGGLTDRGAAELLATFPKLTHISLFAACLSDSAAGQIIADERFDAVGIMRHPDYGGDTPASVVHANGKFGTQTSSQFKKYGCPSEFFLADAK